MCYQKTWLRAWSMSVITLSPSQSVEPELWLFSGILSMHLLCLMLPQSCDSLVLFILYNEMSISGTLRTPKRSHIAGCTLYYGSRDTIGSWQIKVPSCKPGLLTV